MKPGNIYTHQNESQKIILNRITHNVEVELWLNLQDTKELGATGFAQCLWERWTDACFWN